MAESQGFVSGKFVVVLSKAEFDTACTLGEKDFAENPQLDKISCIQHSAAMIAFASATDTKLGANDEWVVFSTHRPNGRLVVHGDDDPTKTYFLVAGESRHWKAIGWIKGEDAMEEGFLASNEGDRACYLIPQNNLTTFDPVDFL